MSDSKFNPDFETSGYFARLIRPLISAARERKDEVEVELRSGFVEHAKRLIEKCSHTRTILSRGEFVSLESFYVAPKLQLGKNKTHDIDTIAKRLSDNKRLVITGSAGLGKSVFMRFLAFKYSSRVMVGPLPVYFELRDLNGCNQSLEDMLLENINNTKKFLSKAQIQHAMSEGLIALFLDAFDEVNPDIRLRYEKEVMSFATKYPDMQICITSRPSPTETIEVWAQFEHAKLLPFTIHQVVELIQKLDEDNDVKTKFIDLLRESLFASHESFLSTPLLALIMFITYQDSLQIPDKLHQFYHRAFEALFYRHDTQKKYARKLYCTLSKDDFLRLMSALCAIIYFESGSASVDEAELKKKIDSAKDIENVKVNSENFLQDLIESICIIQRDGTDMSFTHRSFQEYFTAIFIISSEALDTFGLINRLIARQGFDTVVRMIGDINKEYIEKKWVLRWLDLYKDKVEALSCEVDFIAYVKILRYRAICVVDNDMFRFGFSGWEQDASAISTIITILYFDEYNQSTYYQGINYSKYAKDSEILVKYFFDRNSIKIPRRKAERHITRAFELSSADQEIFVGTEIMKRVCAQRTFLFELKKSIEKRHQHKGEGFMDLIRRNSPKKVITARKKS